MADDTLWVRTVPVLSPLGLSQGFSTVIEIGEDFARELDDAQVMGYIKHLSDVIARAQYEHAVVQMVRGRLAATGDHAAYFLTRLRERAPDLPPSGVPGLHWEPLTSLTAKRPQTTLHAEGLGVSQISAAAAANHMIFVLGAPPTARLDGTLLQMLQEDFDLDEGTARATVGGLGEYRVD